MSIRNRSNFDISVDEKDPITGLVESNLTEGDNETREKQESEASQHVADFVTNQLERLRTDGSVALYEDEFEAQLDD